MSLLKYCNVRHELIDFSVPTIDDCVYTNFVEIELNDVLNDNLDKYLNLDCLGMYCRNINIDIDIDIDIDIIMNKLNAFKNKITLNYIYNNAKLSNQKNVIFTAENFATTVRSLLQEQRASFKAYNMYNTMLVIPYDFYMKLRSEYITNTYSSYFDDFINKFDNPIGINDIVVIPDLKDSIYLIEINKCIQNWGFNCKMRSYNEQENSIMSKTCYEFYFKKVNFEIFVDTAIIKIRKGI